MADRPESLSQGEREAAWEIAHEPYGAYTSADDRHFFDAGFEAGRSVRDLNRIVDVLERADGLLDPRFDSTSGHRRWMRGRIKALVRDLKGEADE